MNYLWSLFSFVSLTGRPQSQNTAKSTHNEIKSQNFNLVESKKNIGRKGTAATKVGSHSKTFLNIFFVDLSWS